MNGVIDGKFKENNKHGIIKRNRNQIIKQYEYTKRTWWIRDEIHSLNSTDDKRGD